MTGTVFNSINTQYIITGFLGKGKSGYSYIINNEKNQYVLKLIHDEECPYYKFTDKMLSEIDAYEQLHKFGIKIPELIEYSRERKYIIKQYIKGLTGTELIAKNLVSSEIYSQLFGMFRVMKSHNLNIDYFPSNFVIENECLFYIDYEINPYKEEWDLINWGIYYWLNTEGMKQFIHTGDAAYINESIDKGIPFKNNFIEKAAELKLKYL